MVVHSKYAEQYGESWRWSTGERIETDEEFDEYDQDEDERRKDWEIV